jgi:uncharacterized protein YjiS (DUF1127 family)
MTTISRTIGQPAILSVAGGFFRLLGKSAAAVLDHLARRQAIQTLNELDDRALRDIGVERGRIEAAVRGVHNPDYGRIM